MEPATLHGGAIEQRAKGGSLARKRYQKGHVFLIGSTWFGKYREDVIGPDGATIRRQVTVTLGSKKDIPTKPLAKRRIEQILARINSVDYRPGRFAKMGEFAERWREQILAGQKPSTKVPPNRTCVCTSFHTSATTVSIRSAQRRSKFS